MDHEILEGFQEETNQILKELAPIVETLEEASDAFPAEELKEFAQKIDRIMGAAKTLCGMESTEHLGLRRIGQIAEICKTLGYKAAELKKPEILPVFAAFWADTLDVVSELTDAVGNDAKSAAIANQFSLVLQKRLRWLADKLAALEKARGDGQVCNQLDVDALLRGFGI